MAEEAERAGPAEFENFYRGEYTRVARLAYSLTGRRDLAEELTQDGFLAAHKNWVKVASLDDPAAWVRRVVVNRCVSSGRRHLTSMRLWARLSSERGEQPQLSEPSDHLWAMVRGLPKRQAQVVALTFLEDRSTADIAAILGCSEETVRTHLRRARLALAARIRESSAADELVAAPLGEEA